MNTNLTNFTNLLFVLIVVIRVRYYKNNCVHLLINGQLTAKLTAINVEISLSVFLHIAIDLAVHITFQRLRRRVLYVVPEAKFTSPKTI